MIYGNPGINEFVCSFQGIPRYFGHRSDHYVDTEFQYAQYLLFRKLLMSSIHHYNDFCRKNHIYPLLDMDIEPHLPCRRNYDCMDSRPFPLYYPVFLSRGSYGRLLNP
jgi:hypothetical protein